MITMNVARSGLAASMMRLNASASNVANADSVGSLPTPVRAGSKGSSAAGQPAYQPITVDQRATAGGGVAATYARGRSGAVMRYDPSSSVADGSGVVAAPDIDLAGERVEQLSASSDFRANLAVIRTADQMQKAAIDLIA